jgi:tyrosine-protein phosphatase SIW14
MRPLTRAIRALIVVACLSVPAWTASAEVAGIPNFRQVSDLVFRGAQPTDEAWPSLAKLGVKTVIDLRQETEHSITEEARAVQAAGMRYISFPMDGFQMPRADQIAKVLEVMNSSEPVFIHCKLGKDRTGTVIAAYRIAHDGWDNDRALTEATACGLHWYEAGMKRFIRGYRAAALATASGGDSLASSMVPSGQ